jgi:hypothetical protein
MRSFTKERSALIALLLDMPLGEPTPVAGIADLSTDDKLFMLSTLCADTIAETVWLMSRFDKAKAVEGLSGLFEGICDNINRRVDGQM